MLSLSGICIDIPESKLQKWKNIVFYLFGFCLPCMAKTDKCASQRVKVLLIHGAETLLSVFKECESSVRVSVCTCVWLYHHHHQESYITSSIFREFLTPPSNFYHLCGRKMIV